MKINVFAIGILSFIMIGCFQHKPEDVFSQAHQIYEVHFHRYSDIIGSCNDEQAIENLRLLGHDRALSFGSAMWQSLWGNDYLVQSNGAPLHKAAFFIEADIRELETMLLKLERFGLFSRPIYGKIQELRLELMTLLRLIRGQREYSTEAQYIEQRRLQKAQYSEQQEQTQLLREMNKKKSTPQVTTKKTSRDTINIFIDKRSMK